MGSGCSKIDLDQHDHYVGTLLEFKDNSETFFKPIKITDSCTVLVAKNRRGEFTALGSKCSHYGADLSKGVMSGGRIYCPWHGACFDFASGDIEEFPGLDGIPKYLCKVKDHKVYVHVDPESIQYKVMRPLAKARNSHLTFAIIGSGAAGYMCAQTLRQEGFEGKVIMVTADKHLPYDRPKLSKALGSEWEDIKLRGKTFFEDNDIEVILGATVDELNTVDHRIIMTATDGCIIYDSIFIATGNKPRLYESGKVSGTLLKNILTLHDFEESKFIAKNLAGKKIVICGSSFIAMELASSLKDKCAQIDMIARSDAPYSFVLGFQFGFRMLEHLLEKAPNVRFHAVDEVISFNGNAAGEVTSVTTLKTELIPCDYVILAIGAIPAVEFVYETPMALNSKNGTITVNKYMQTNLSFTYAGGDCCTFPLDVGGKGTANIGHWQVAMTHGRVAALNMMGNQISIQDIIPFFWTSVCGVQIRYCGYGESYDEILLFGSLEDLQFCLVYRRGKRFCAACGIGVDPLITALAVELQTQAKWDTEFPDCLLKRFPVPPALGLTVSEIAGIAARLAKETES